MTNYEKNKEWFDEHELGIKICGRAFAVDIVTQKPVYCQDFHCAECEFQGDCGGGPREKWLKAEAKEERKVDWDSVQKDTLIEVKLDDYSNLWVKRYFSEHKDGKVFFYSNGTTSKTFMTISDVETNSARICSNN